MKNVFLAVKEDGVSGVVSSLVPGNNVEVRREKINDLALAFVTPLGADHNQISQSISQGVVNRFGGGCQSSWRLYLWLCSRRFAP